MTAKHFNFIYEKLVASENDLIGLLAYGLYKRHKIDFIRTFNDEHGRDPTEAEFQPFYTSSTVSNQLDRYKEQAGRLLDDFSEVLLTEKAEDIAESIYAGSEAIHEIKKLNRSFWNSVGENVVVTIITTVATLALSFLVIAWSIGIEDIGKQALAKWLDSNVSTLKH